MRQTLVFLAFCALTCQAAVAQTADRAPRRGPTRERAARQAPRQAGLSAIGWMIGEWVDQDENSTITTTCKWTKNKNFITRSFSVEIEGHISLEGTQVIGWDPEAGRIRSWIFDSEGGYGEGQWSRRGRQWVIKSSQTLKDGERASSINVITPIDRNTFTWQSVGREIDGELLPNIPEVTVVRKQSR